MRRNVSFSKLRFSRNLPSRPSCVKSVVYFADAGDFDIPFEWSPRRVLPANTFENTNDASIATAANRLVVEKPNSTIFIISSFFQGEEICGTCRDVV